MRWAPRGGARHDGGLLRRRRARVRAYEPAPRPAALPPQAGPRPASNADDHRHIYDMTKSVGRRRPSAYVPLSSTLFQPPSPRMRRCSSSRGRCRPPRPSFAVVDRYRPLLCSSLPPMLSPFRLLCPPHHVCFARPPPCLPKLAATTRRPFPLLLPPHPLSALATGPSPHSPPVAPPPLPAARCRPVVI